MPISLSVQVFRAGSSPSLQTRTVTPSASTSTYSPSSGYDGFSSFTVSGDSNFIASNIRKGTTIWRITGTLKPVDSYMSWGGGSTFTGDGSTSHFFSITTFNPSNNMLQWGIAISNGGVSNNGALMFYHYLSVGGDASVAMCLNGTTYARKGTAPTKSSTGITVSSSYTFYSGTTYSYIIYAVYYTG